MLLSHYSIVLRLEERKVRHDTASLDEDVTWTVSKPAEPAAVAYGIVAGDLRLNSSIMQ